MRGTEREQPGLFSYEALEDRIPADHPLRTIRPLVNRSLGTVSATFDQIYADGGRPSIPPEQLLRALLLQVLYTIRSERQLMEQLQYNLLYRWFVRLGVDDPVWDVTVFTKNRQRLLIGDVAEGFLRRRVGRGQAGGAAVDGALHGGRFAGPSVGGPEESSAGSGEDRVG